MKAHSISVPTKQCDETMLWAHHVGEYQNPQDDAFSRYSENFVRMKALFLLSEEEEEDYAYGYDDLDALAKINQALSSMGLSNLAQTNRDKRRKGNNSARIKQGHERKTRLSWEIHPDVLLYDFIEVEELEALDNGAHHIFDDEMESSEKKPRSKVLEQEVTKKEG